MTASPATARVLIAAEDLADGEQVVSQLQEHFEHVKLSTNPDRGVADFQTHQTDVLVLAFNTIAKAQSYYLGLYRTLQSLSKRPHRTVLLCSKDEVSAAFNLCKKQYFDDYVPYWPMAYDGLRLPMSIWSICRELAALQAQGPPRKELLAHAKQLGDLEQTLHNELSAGQQRIATAEDCMQNLERKLAASSDEFSRYVIDGAGGSVVVKDAAVLNGEFALLRNQQIELARTAREQGVGPMSAWAQEMKERVEPALAGVRTLADSVRNMPAKIMIIDDDELMRDLLVRVLGGASYEISYAKDSEDALRQLRDAQPDVILMDIHLPGLDGISLTRRLKSNEELASIPIILITGDPRRETVKGGLDAGAVSFVVKPFTRKSLKEKLDRAMAR